MEIIDTPKNHILMAAGFGFAGLMGGWLFLNSGPTPSLPGVQHPTHPAIAAGAAMSFHTAGGEKMASAFHAPEMVMALIDFPSPLFGAHTLEAKWIEPNGTVFESTRLPLEFPKTGGQRVNLWLRFKSGENRILSEAASKNQSTRNGEWTVRVQLDETPVSEGKFVIKGY